MTWGFIEKMNIHPLQVESSHIQTNVMYLNIPKHNRPFLGTYLQLSFFCVVITFLTIHWKTWFKILHYIVFIKRPFKTLHTNIIEF
jgi:hypothetical protein